MKQGPHRRAAKYRGKKCITCGNRMRYRSNNCCTLCHVQHNERYRRRLGQQPRDQWRLTVRKEAVERGDKFYDGRPCVRCGNVKRYSRNSECYNCAQLRELTPRRIELRRKARNKRYHAAQNALRAQKFILGLGGT
jgi:hypothetical protein